MNINFKPNNKMKVAIRLPVLMPVLLSTLFFATVPAAAQTPASIEGVALSSMMTTKDGQKLQLVGAGLRSKKVLMVPVRVYVAELFLADLTKFKKNPTESLKSVSEAAPAMIQLHFLRDVDAEKVQSSFKEALEANKIDLKKPEIQKVLDAVRTGGDAKKGKSLLVLGVKKSDGSEVITYEDSNSKATTISGGAGFIQDIFSIWLGQPSDDGVAKLKADILK